MSKTYKKERRKLPCPEEVEKSVTLEYLNFIAEREDYPEVAAFVDNVCENVMICCPFYEISNGVHIFTPRVNNKKLDKLGITPTEFHSYEFKFNDKNELIKEYVFYLSSNSNVLLGIDLRVSVTFNYGLIRIANFVIDKKNTISTLTFPILYPYKYTINSLESDYRVYFPSKELSGTIKLSNEAIGVMRNIEFDVVVNTAEIACSYKEEHVVKNEAELAFYEGHFNEDKATLLSKKARMCLPSKINTSLFFAGNEMGVFEEKAIRYTMLKYEVSENVIATVIRYLPRFTKKDKVKFETFEFKGEQSVSYETEYLRKMFNLERSEDTKSKEYYDISERILGILKECLTTEKSYIDKKVDFFEYHEVFDEEKLSKQEMKVQYIKSFKYPLFTVEEDDIKVNGADDRRVVESYRVVYEKREFFVFLVKKVRKLCAYLSLISLNTCDLKVGYVETSSAVMFEVSFRDNERIFREAFVEETFNAWEYLKNGVKADVIKSSRVRNIITEKKGNVDTVSLYKADI